MMVVTCEQLSVEWFTTKLGIPSASHFREIITTGGKPSTSAKGYLHKLAAERISKIRDPSFYSKATEEGIRREEESRLVYSMLYEVEVEQVGFCLSDCGRYGCSPDGLIDLDGLVEFKNPSGKIAIEALLKGKLPTKYTQQVQGQLLVTGRVWCDFMSYYPGLPPLIVRVKRDEAFLDALKQELVAFCDKLDEVCKTITEKEE